MEATTLHPLVIQAGKDPERVAAKDLVVVNLFLSLVQREAEMMMTMKQSWNLTRKLREV